MTHPTLHPSSPAISCTHVTKRFADITAVNDVSFSVHPGEIFGLLGPNGAGKTTCLRILATLLQPDEGHASVASYDCATQPQDVRKALGYQTGDTRLYERLKPIEFLRYFGQLHQMPKALLQERIDLLVQNLDITPFQDSLCGALSTGQQQRVSIARALLHDPPVIILDEPTNGLDILSSHYLVELLQHERQRGKAILLSTHIMGEAEILCDRIAIMHRGRIAWCDSTQNLLQDTRETTLARAFLSVLQNQEDPQP